MRWKMPTHRRKAKQKRTKIKSTRKVTEEEGLRVSERNRERERERGGGGGGEGRERKPGYAQRICLHFEINRVSPSACMPR